MEYFILISFFMIGSVKVFMIWEETMEIKQVWNYGRFRERILKKKNFLNKRDLKRIYPNNYSLRPDVCKIYIEMLK